MLKFRGRGGFNRYLPEHLLARTSPSESLKPDELEPSIATTRKDALVLSYEDWELDHPKMPRLLRPTERGTDHGVPSYRVFLLRDPFNLFASLLYSKRMNQQNSPYYVRTWKQYAREYLGRTSFLGSAAVGVSYNEWRDSEEYRLSLCRRLGLPEDPKSFTHVASTGGGSSFDGLAGDAGQLRTEERWKHFADDKFYLSLFDEELRGLSREAFGAAPV